MSDATGPAGTASPDRGRTTPLGKAFAAIDGTGERWTATVRDRRWADVSAAVLSNISDHGAVWVLAAAWKARHPGPARRRAVAALALAGVSSYCVNRTVKQLVGRSRPDQPASPVQGMPVRTPASSSFPSGHTLAAFCTAMVLPDRPTFRRAALAFAAAVAASRVHMRAHHASDVLGGATIGTVVGTIVRPLVDVLASGPCARKLRSE